MGEKVVDPVCKMDISREAAFASIDHEGRTYYFCAPSCRDKFKKSPKDFIGKTRRGRRGEQPR